MRNSNYVTRGLLAFIVWATLAKSGLAQGLEPEEQQQLTIEIVRFLKASPAAADWNSRLGTATAGQVLVNDVAARRNVGTSVAARLRASADSASVATMVGSTWRCLSKRGPDRQQCALEDAPFFLNISEPRIRGDTATVTVMAFVRAASPRAGIGPYPFSVVVVRTGGRWIGKRVTRPHL